MGFWCTIILFSGGGRLTQAKSFLELLMQGRLYSFAKWLSNFIRSISIAGFRGGDARDGIVILQIFPLRKDAGGMRFVCENLSYHVLRILG